MPGDYTAPSRFIKATMLQQSTQNYTPENQEQAVGLALRILQNFGTPKGSVVEVNDGKLDYTQWGVVRDHKNLVYYFFTQFNNNIFSVDLSKINFETVKPNGISIEQPVWTTDITPSLQS
jgi:choloylglycine hydrolase